MYLNLNFVELLYCPVYFQWDISGMIAGTILVDGQEHNVLIIIYKIKYKKYKLNIKIKLNIKTKYNLLN